MLDARKQNTNVNTEIEKKKRHYLPFRRLIPLLARRTKIGGFKSFVYDYNPRTGQETAANVDSMWSARDLICIYIVYDIYWACGYKEAPRRTKEKKLSKSRGLPTSSFEAVMPAVSLSDNG